MHSLIDLDPPGDDPRSANVDDLAADFVEKSTVSETTVLYQAQVAVENRSRIKKNETHDRTSGAKKSKEATDISKLKALECQEFSVKRPDDKRNVDIRGVLALADKVVVIDASNNKLKLYDSSGNYLSSTDLMDNSTEGITLVNKDQFATCGLDRKVYLWTIRGDTIVVKDVLYDLDHMANGIHYNGTYYCIIHQLYYAVTIIRHWRSVRKIVMREAFGKEITFRYDIHMDCDTHNIYIPCWGYNSGVLCMSVEGKAVWFTPLSDASLWGITEIHDTLCVADSDKQCLHLMSKIGQYKKKLLGKDKLGKRPCYICYDEHGKKLYVSFSRYDQERRDKMSLFPLQS